jgi:capsular exopolysaccharide synthesis family protein
MTPPERGAARPRAEAGWRRPRVDNSGIQRYFETVRERWRLVAIVTLLTTAVAVLYVATAPKVYEADADLLVTPVSSDDPVLTGLGLIRESSDPTRDVETAARLVTSRNVADLVRTQLNLPEDAEAVASKVDAVPVAQSNIVAVTARADSPELARDLANGFAEGVVAERSEVLRSQLDPLIERTRERIQSGEDISTDGASLVAELDQLERLKIGGDPSMRVSTPAVASDSPVAPRPMVTLFAGLLAGLVLGIGGAFAVQAIDPRLRREEQLRDRYSLPILARIPRERGGSTPARPLRRDDENRRPLGPSELSPRTVEAYRTLRTVLSIGAEQTASGRAILVTGPSPAEGKTTTAVNLATSFALAGQKVILIEGDFRRPSVARALRVRPRVRIEKVLLGEATLQEALVTTELLGDDLRVLPSVRSSDRITELLSLPVARKLLDDARELADVVVLDTPPLTEVIDALPLARYVDDVLIVCRLGATNLDRLTRLSDLLDQNEIEPAGFVLVGAGSSEEESYYMAGRRETFDETPTRPTGAAAGNAGNGRSATKRSSPATRS